MKKLHRLRLRSPSESQRACLTRWLLAWDIERHLVDGPAGDATLDAREGKAEVSCGARDNVAELDADVECGQIRLFSPKAPGAPARPLYVAVLAGAGDEVFLVAPFSRFDEPAVPGEVLTGKNAKTLRVLCLWNARDLSAALLSLSWVVDALTSDEQAKFRRAYASLQAHGRVPDDIAEIAGPPLQHPADPRHEYLEQDGMTLSRLADGDPVQRPKRSRLDYPEPESRDLPKVAEDRGPFDEPQDSPSS